MRFFDAENHILKRVVLDSAVPGAIDQAVFCVIGKKDCPAVEIEMLLQNTGDFTAQGVDIEYC